MSSRQGLVAAAFVLPACALIGLFIFWPALVMARTSLLRQELTAPQAGRYCGAENYRALWRDGEFRQAARNTACFAALVVPLQSVLALLLALWTNRPGGAVRALRLAVFIPTTVSLTVLSVLWKLLYAPAGAAGAGLINGMLSALGLPAQPFLTSPRQALLCIVLMSAWQGAGFQMLIFLAGLQTIPRQHYEAALLDGAGGWRSFRHITLPGLAPSALVVVMITTIFALKLFVQPYLMTGGGPRAATVSLVQYMYKAAFARRDLGLACAAGLVFFLAVAAVALVQRLALRRVESWQ